jgi:predicted phosphodiesterase
MNRIFITGDTHGEIDIKKLSGKNFKEGNELTKNDFLIICGDFGLIWDNTPSKTEKYWTKWLTDKPWTTLFIDGNHENHPRLNQLEQIEKFGGTVGKVNDSIFHLKRGEIYIINNKKFFTFGGAESTDKAHRTIGIDWWQEEEANYKEFDYGLDNLDKHNNKIDYIITHTLPIIAIEEYFQYLQLPIKRIDATSKYLQTIYETTEFKEWFGGHFHEDSFNYDKINFLFYKIVEI